MLKKTRLNPVSAAIGTTFAVSLATSPIVNAESNPFSMAEYESGYMVADNHGKAGEGKCGEGKCGEGKSSEGKCGEGKSSEGKCGEGKCGEGKSSEGKCGEGKGRNCTS